MNWRPMSLVLYVVARPLGHGLRAADISRHIRLSCSLSLIHSSGSMRVRFRPGVALAYGRMPRRDEHRPMALVNCYEFGVMLVSRGPDRLFGRPAMGHKSGVAIALVHSRRVKAAEGEIMTRSRAERCTRAWETGKAAHGGPDLKKANGRRSFSGADQCTLRSLEALLSIFAVPLVLTS